MYRSMILLCGALLAASLAHAQLDELSVRFAPGVSEIPESWNVWAYARANSQRAEYRADLARREGGVFVMLPDEVPNGHRLYVSRTTGQVFAAGLSAGEYRLRTYASEGPGTPELMVSKRFRVVERDTADWRVARDRYSIVSAYEWTLGCWQDYVAALRKRQFLMADLSWDFEHFLTQPAWCQPEDVNQFGAPGGGAWVIAGQPGDGDATGAVVVTAHGIPAGPDDLHDIAVSVTLPAYPGVPDLVRRTERVAWEPGIADPVTAIANLSLRLYPAGTEYALDGTPIPMWATVDGGKASFAFELERRDGTAWLHEESWQGDSMIRWQPRRAGQYRLRVTAVEEGGDTTLEETRTFRVIGPRHADYERVRARNALDRNVEAALAFVRSRLHAVKRKLTRKEDVTAEFNDLSASALLASAFVTQDWGGAHFAAPGGGPAIIGGVAGDGDATGAIVFNVEWPPAATDDWDYTTVHVTYPAYAPAGTQRRTVTVRYR